MAAITGLTSCRRLKIFASCSLDGSVRVWNCNNTLLRCRPTVINWLFCYFVILLFSHFSVAKLLLTANWQRKFKKRSVSGTGNRHLIPTDRVPAVAMNGLQASGVEPPSPVA